MYSQQQQYNHQQQHAPAPQQELVWDGTAWVSKQPQQQQQPTAPSSANLVHLYSQYYQDYTALLKQTEAQLADPYLSQQQRLEAESKRDWYRYYADASSRVAHFFNQNPAAVHLHQCPHEAPPPPPRASLLQQQPQPAAAAAVAQQQPQQQTTTFPQQQHSYAPPHHQPSLPQQSHLTQPTGSLQQQQQQQQQPGSQAPNGLKNYMDRCLSQCSTDAQKQAMMEQVTKVIESAVKSGTLHSTNWGSVQLIPLQGLGQGTTTTTIAATKAAAISAPANGGHLGPPSSSVAISTSEFGGSGGAGYYGPSSATMSPPSSDAGGSGYFPSSGMKKKKNRKTKDRRQHQIQQSLPDGDNYYGPASSSSPFNSTNLSFHQQQHLRNADSFGSSDNDVNVIKSKKNKKRKLEHKDSGFNQSSLALVDRAKRFAGPGGIHDAASSANRKVPGFERYMGQSVIGGSVIELDEMDFENMKVKGTCLVLDKDYLRLTAPPKAELVRPQPVLEQHLVNLKEERRRDEGKRRDYLWFCSQLKAVRQDCTVQHLQNEFVVDVYETHARIALEEGDLNEYNQCQTQLKELYNKLGAADPKSVANRNEFIAYRLLYYVFLSGNKKYDGGSSDVFKIMIDLSCEDRHHPAIQHALRVRVAVTDVDYHAFFRLLRECPNLGRYLMDRIVPSLRYNALLRICKSYRPSVETEFILSELGFLVTSKSSNDDDGVSSNEDLEYGIEWLLSCGVLLSDDKEKILTAESAVHESNMEAKKSLI